MYQGDFGHIILRNQHLIVADVKYLVLVSIKHQFPSVRVSNITTPYNLSQDLTVGLSEML